ncbi:hypothetical protein B4935_18020 [Vibrio cholerae]|nr:hypothetical protein [Vibrio cholerae]MCD1216929.1 hypothetical protein [Vibrio cholerae]MCD1235090.1 hypothetical protein [Vibrio cholerae]MCD1242272.1 hypothetical protein [Vibrio cholerae]MCD1257075.1 hypothetical protein [Vibrio cholerae]
MLFEKFGCQIVIFRFPTEVHSHLQKPNARLRGWQRITTKLNHNNRNPRGSLGLETPRVDSPS